MNVLVTVVFLAGVAAWFFVAYSRLLRLRERVKEAWRQLETDQSNQSAKTVYNRAVQTYNTALDGFPANVVAMLAGFKPARSF